MMFFAVFAGKTAHFAMQFYVSYFSCKTRIPHTGNNTSAFFPDGNRNGGFLK